MKLGTGGRGEEAGAIADDAEGSGELATLPPKGTCNELLALAEEASKEGSVPVLAASRILVGML